MTSFPIKQKSKNTESVESTMKRREGEEVEEIEEWANYNRHLAFLTSIAFEAFCGVLARGYFQNGAINDPSVATYMTKKVFYHVIDPGTQGYMIMQNIEKGSGHGVVCIYALIANVVHITVKEFGLPKMFTPEIETGDIKVLVSSIKDFVRAGNTVLPFIKDTIDGAIKVQQGQPCTKKHLIDFDFERGIY